MACFHVCLNELPSEFRGFAFKGTDLIYIHCVSNENWVLLSFRWSVEKNI